MSAPRLLLIDDEPILAKFLAEAATICGYDPIVTQRDEEFRDEFVRHRPDMVALDLGMPGTDGVELIRFLADNDFTNPVMIISGFDRRVLDSAFRLGSAMGLNMVGPIEKPARLEQIEMILAEAKSSVGQ